MNMESSVTRSISSESHSADSFDRVNIGTVGVERIFPLYDYLLQYANVPSIIYYVCIVVYYFQQLYVSFWYSHSNIWGKSSMNISFLNYYTYIFLFQLNSEDDTNLLIVSIAYLIVAIIVISVFSAQLIIYNIKRRFYKLSLIPSRIAIELIPSIMILPTGSQFGRLFHQIMEKNYSALIILSTIITLICLICFLYIHVTTFRLISYSPYLSSSPVSAFTLKPMIVLGSANSTLLALSYIFAHLYDWLAICLTVFHICVAGYVCFLLTQRPFTKQSSNVIFGGLALSSILLDISILAMKPFSDFNGDIFVYIIFAFLVLAIVLSFVFNKVQTAKLHKKFLFFTNEDGQIREEEGSPSDEQKLQRFQELNIDSSNYNMILYLDFSISNRESLNTDLSMVKYILQKPIKTDLLAHCMRIVAFFPMESRLLSIMMGDCYKRRDLSQTHRFLLYQLNRIKILRQSSASVQAADKLRNMKNQTKEVYTEIISFWDQQVASTAFLSKLRAMVSKTRALWDESLQDFPNSVQNCEEYCHFLIECSTDFSAAIRQKHRAELIESGRNFSIDRCFRQFISNFPDYLKKGTVDTKGMIITSKKKRSGSSSSGSSGNNRKSSNSNFSNTFSSMDLAMEEGIAKILITHARMRTALQNATNEKKAKNSGKLKIVSLFCLLLMLGSCSFLYFYFINIFNNRNSVADRIELSNQIRLNLYSSTACLLLHLVNQIEVFDDSSMYADIGTSDSNLWFNPYFNRSNSWKQNALMYTVKSREYYVNFLKNIAEFTMEHLDYDIYTLTGPLLNESLDLTFCANGGPITAQKDNLQSILSYLYYLQSNITGNTDYFHWYAGFDHFCTLIRTLESLFNAFTSLRTSLSLSSTNDYSDTQKVVDLIMYILPLSLFVISFTSFLVVALLYYFELIKFLKMLINLDSTVKHEASMPLRKDSNGEEEIAKRATESSGVNSTVYILILFAIGFIVVSILIFVQLFNSISGYNSKFNYMTTWLMNARLCKSLSIEMLIWSLEAVIISNSSVIPETNVTTREMVLYLLQEDATRLQNAMNIITQEKDDIPPPSSFDSDLNRLLHSEQCIMNASNTNLHELYRCSSVEHLILFYMDMITELLVKLDTYQGLINTDVPLNVLHISQAHVVPVLISVDESFENLYKKFLSAYKTEMNITYSIEFILSVFIFIMMILLALHYDSCYGSILLLLRRVNPIAVVARAELIEYILDRSSDKSSAVMTTARSVIHNSTDCILCIALNGIIENINPSVTNLLGYTPDQLLGQHITTVIDENEKQKILSQIGLIKNKQSPPTYEDHTTTITDDDTKIPCAITILGMTSQNDENSIKSFVIIFRNETQLLQQQKEAEEAKKQSESLLYQILPRDIVLRINRGEKDISFSVPSSTIMFIDIVKFSEYAATLTPKEIMCNLSMLFGAFDEALTNYEQLLKIKLIGDVYMCAGGLFSPDEPPVVHAEQMIKFGFDALSFLDETNIKLNAVLSVRIGVNTGGPLIAGVLGTDKPVFDIIGDPINIASRLQSTDIPGNIQISQDTYNLVNTNELFSIEPRGEIYLKGKGKTNSFLVRPGKPNMTFQLSSHETPTNSSTGLQQFGNEK
ncbi:Adenylate and Guanylate cyclase catalytic domain containing protein [Tritrichomonas foetus]|uniref:Adenylate and Guanylate cyclase catalytic domain containing protein n=1 Tax=Tritrichomonas foetus TaxID=1144522 RepID=A0A1J4KHB0_9EUKA|nr:Adenylate and Guanylate cyclase catalytic domain containing protein [Tritrichomonas foetus]|eukprot:OHT09038.1 Adenylate and Guanylate cyclase catalytic domain containing protein [Tritrichomonas foetus]